MTESLLNRYKIISECWSLWVEVEVDHNILTRELAEEINGFWTDSDDRLDDAEGDPVVAVIKYAASFLLSSVLETESLSLAQKELDGQEGFPPVSGIRLIDFEIPDIRSTNLTIEKL